MCRINLFIIAVLCSLVLSAAAEESGAPEIDYSKNPEAWMNSPSRRRPDPGRPMSPEMKAVSDHPELLEKLKEEDFAKMSLDDPLLKYVCADIFTRSSLGRVGKMDAQQVMVLADLRRRGESASPMLLKVIEENQETPIESCILGLIDELGTVRLDPFLEYARKLVRERPNSDVVAAAAILLAKQGTKEDITLLEGLLEQRPFAVTYATKSLKALRERLNPPQTETRPERREKPSSHAGSDAHSAKGTVKHPQDGGTVTSQSKLWLTGGMVLVVLLGIYRLLRKRLRRPQP
jgi:hypothetical protein